MPRVLVGAHPQGPFGVFVSKPGVEVLNLAPSDPNGHLFSSEWGDVLNIAAASTCALGDTVTIPDLGYKPLIRWEQQTTNGWDCNPVTSVTYQNTSSNVNQRFTFSRFKLVYLNNYQFQIVKREPVYDTAAAGLPFRYIAFSLSLT